MSTDDNDATAGDGHHGVDRVHIRDVGPRDGLQGERPADVGARVQLVAALAAAGVADIEAVAFVSPKAVPAMAGAADVIAAVDTRLQCEHDLLGLPRPTIWALVPNVRGAELAVAAGVDHLTITLSASAAYSAKNVQMTIAEAQAQVAEIRAVAPEAVLDEVISCSFGSPFAGEAITPDDVAALVAHAADVGIDQVTLADTTGVATPARVARLLDVVGSDLGLHLHDTRGTALLNAWTAIERGVRRFDTALGGLGGSPFAPTAGGNLATEDLVLVLDDAGIATGIDLDALLAAGPHLAALVGHDLPSRVATAGPLTPTATATAT